MLFITVWNQVEQKNTTQIWKCRLETIVISKKRWPKTNLETTLVLWKLTIFQFTMECGCFLKRSVKFAMKKKLAHKPLFWLFFPGTPPNLDDSTFLLIIILILCIFNYSLRLRNLKFSKLFFNSYLLTKLHDTSIYFLKMWKKRLGVFYISYKYRFIKS